MKPESLVMPCQLRRREYVPGLVHTPVTSWKSLVAEAGELTAREAAAYAMSGDWDEVVTR